MHLIVSNTAPLRTITLSLKMVLNSYFVCVTVVDADCNRLTLIRRSSQTSTSSDLLLSSSLALQAKIGIPVAFLVKSESQGKGGWL